MKTLSGKSTPESKASRETAGQPAARIKPSFGSQLMTLCKLLVAAGGTVFAIWLIDAVVTSQ